MTMKTKKLGLHRETLRALSSDQLEGAAGGAKVPRTSICYVTKNPLICVVATDTITCSAAPPCRG